MSTPPPALQAVNLDYFTPDDLLDVMNHLDAAINDLDKTLLRDSIVPTDFYDGFSSFESDWKTWSSGHTGFFGWFTRISNNVRDELLNYVAEYNSWRAKYIGLGGQPSPTASEIAPDKPEKSVFDGLKNLGSSSGLALGHIALGLAAVAVVVIGGAYVVRRVFR